MVVREPAVGEAGVKDSQIVYEFRLGRGPRKREWVAAPLALVVFVVLLAEFEPRAFELPHWELWLALPGTVALALAHELAHYAVQRRAGARPRIGYQWPGRAYTLAEGFRFSRRWWLASLFAPLATTVPLAIVLTIVMVRPWTLWLAMVAPLACAADVEFAVRTLRWAGPRDLVEDRAEGFAVLRPACTSTVA